MIAPSTADNAGKRRLSNFSIKAFEYGRRSNTSVPSGWSSRMSYSMVMTLSKPCEDAHSSANRRWRSGGQLSTTRIARLRNAIRSDASAMGWGSGLSAMLVYKASEAGRLCCPTRSSNSACTNRVFPRPERPTRRTTPTSVCRISRILVIPSTTEIPPSLSFFPVRTRTASSTRYSPSTPSAGYAQAPYGCQPLSDLPIFCFTHRVRPECSRTQVATRLQS